MWENNYHEGGKKSTTFWKNISQFHCVSRKKRSGAVLMELLKKQSARDFRDHERSELIASLGTGGVSIYSSWFWLPVLDSGKDC